MLKLTDTAPVAVAVGEATVTLAAANPRIVAAGRAAVRRALDEDADLEPQIATLAFSEGVLIAAITGWEGIGSAGGDPLDCSKTNVALALQDTLFFDTLDREYVIPIYRREQEKNASAVSSAGTSAGATAGKTIAGSAAGSKRGPMRLGKPKPKSAGTKRGTKTSSRKKPAAKRKATKPANRPQAAKR